MACAADTAAAGGGAADTGGGAGGGATATTLYSAEGRYVGIRTSFPSLNLESRMCTARRLVGRNCVFKDTYEAFLYAFMGTWDL